MVRTDSIHSALHRRIRQLPDQPGVYLFRDAQGVLLYVGKALSLCKRVSSYIREAQLSPRIAKMMAQVSHLEVRPTASAAEALLLEAQLIKELKPRYNVAFRDDKTYPLLKVTREKFARLLITRKRAADGAFYFGPYPDSGLMHQAVQFLRRVFPLRTCRVFPKSPCLEYHIGQCLAPCVGFIGEADYQRIVRDLVAFLEGKGERLLKDLVNRMKQAAGAQRYEEAARLRDQIQALSSVIVAKEKSHLSGPLEQLQAALKLPSLPHRIEAFDISNLFGEDAVGSMVVFQDARPLRASYRRFRIKTVRGIDDYQMMREVIRRRYGGSLASTLPLPQLILIDGGKGQLQAACDELAALSLNVPAVGLAKRFEHLFLPSLEKPIILLPTSPVLHLVQHIRDEAHRFAITYHRQLHRRRVRASRLDGVLGIGPVRKRQLLRQFGSMRKLSEAKPELIAQTARISLKLANKIVEVLRHES
ncbi:MAG: excinuclease ABC subunit UvrC [Candidatus Omnitrophica bacterium]|nr:excinuclease ABC subunit UvrC [Candidatus Omnitrophota bacterium]